MTPAAACTSFQLQRGLREPVRAAECKHRLRQAPELVALHSTWLVPPKIAAKCEIRGLILQTLQYLCMFCSPDALGFNLFVFLRLL